MFVWKSNRQEIRKVSKICTYILSFEGGKGTKWIISRGRLQDLYQQLEVQNILMKINRQEIRKVSKICTSYLLRGETGLNEFQGHFNISVFITKCFLHSHLNISYNKFIYVCISSWKDGKHTYDDKNIIHNNWKVVFPQAPKQITYVNYFGHTLITGR